MAAWISAVLTCAWTVHSTWVFSALVLFMSTVVEQVKGQHLTNPVEFVLQEQQHSGFNVGDISKASGLSARMSAAELATLRYKFLNPNNLQTASLFSLNSDSGVLYTSAMIDRESVCPYEESCVISFVVTVSSQTTQFFEMLTVRVDIVDINDNAPRFPTDEVTLYIAEDANIKSEYKIKGATDPDKGPGNSVEKYDMRSDDDTFSLDVERNLDGTWSLNIVTNRQLDREQRDHYRFFIVAKDGGRPPLSGTLTVNVNVTDANDNSPTFTENIYDITVAENKMVGSVVGQVTALDRDTGQNAQIVYSFSPQKRAQVEKLFYIDSQSGEIKVKSGLVSESGNSFETIVMAMDRGNPPQTAQAVLILRVVDVQNDPPQIKIYPVGDRTGNTITLSEGAAISSVFAHVEAVDRDPGMNGVVTCGSLDPAFRVERFEDRGFLVKVADALDRETRQEHNLTIECWDSGSPSLKSASSIMIRLTDENDNNPQFDRQIYRANITENNRIGEHVLRVTARDRDYGINAAMTYLISFEEDSMFSINRDTGEITANAVFDRETMSEITFMVKAVDEGEIPRTGSASVVIDITDKNDNAPYFTSSMVFEIPEKLPGGERVGQLRAADDDEGINAKVTFMELTSGSSVPQVPFIVLSDGMIRSDRELFKSVQDRYEMMVVAKDSGVPPLNTTAKVIINVIDSNDNKPIIEFPNPENNTVIVRSDTKPGETVTKIIAYDEDEGRNSVLKYYIAGGNDDKVFSIPYPESGDIILLKDLGTTSVRSYALKIEVQDQGMPQQTTASELLIKVDFVGGHGPGHGSGPYGHSYGQNRNRNSTASTFFGDEDLKYVIIAGVVGGVTVIASIIIITIIIRLRRPVHERRRGGGVIGGVQEQGDGRHFDKQLWHSVPADDVSPMADAGEKHLDLDNVIRDKDVVKGNSSFLADRHTPDITDAYIKKHGGDQYGGQQQLYTFKKCPGRAPSDDFQSDTSGETTASDSGRGGSEEDIQLLPLPEMSVDTSRLVFAHGPEALLKDRRFMYTNTAPASDDPENIAFETFSPRTLPTYANQLPRDPGQPTAFRDVHTLGSTRPMANEKRIYENTNGRRMYHHGQATRSANPLMRETNFGGKRVTFKNDLTAQNLKTLELANKFAPAPMSPMPPEAMGNNRGMDRSPSGGFYPSLTRSHDDDDNTTTSGSYTLNVEDDIDDLPPPVSQSVA